MKKLADELLRELQLAPIGTLHNNDMNADFYISKKDRQKMGNNHNLSHQASQAVSELEKLVKYAVRAETHQDEKHHNERVKAVHRLYAPAEIDGKIYRIKLTVKDYLLNNGIERKNLHAIEAVEIETAPMGTLPSDVSKQGTVQPTSGQNISIADLMHGAQRNDGNLFEKNQYSFGSRKIQQYISDLQKSINRVLGKHAELVKVVSRDELVRPENAQSLNGVEGFYNPKDGSITLVAENLQNTEHAAFVAWHELGHRKADLNGYQDWKNRFNEALRHSTVQQLADAIQQQRKGTNDPAANNRTIAAEEAIMELYAAHETGDYSRLQEKYGVKIPRALQNNLGGFLTRLGEKLAAIVKRALGLKTNPDVFQMLKDLHNADVSNNFKNEINSDVKQYSKAADGNAVYTEDEKAAILQGNPVFIITERTAPHENKALREWANQLFNQIGNKAINPELGEVLLNDRSVKDSMAHGMNPNKAMAFEAIPSVIESGVVVAQAKHDNMISYFISAPVDILGKQTIVTALIHQDVNTRRMYLHSVITKEKLLNTAPKESAADTNVSQPRGKLYSEDIASILQNYLTRNISSDEIRYSRSTPQSVANMASTGQITQDKGFIRSLITGDFTSAFNYFTQAKNSLIESVVNHLHPVAT